MRRQDNGLPGPRWRAILEARWRIRLQEVTELSLAYHAATADAPDGIEDRHARRLLRRAVGARHRLADTEEALGRLASGASPAASAAGPSRTTIGRARHRPRHLDRHQRHDRNHPPPAGGRPPTASATAARNPVTASRRTG